MTGTDFRRAAGMAALFLCSGLVAACASGPRSAAPSWATQPTRAVDSGYIVHVGAGEDTLPERATFKAESEALQDLANECSFAPKGTRIEDRVVETADGKNKAWVKVAVDFESCEEAKRATEPARIRELANQGFTDQIKRYQEQIDHPIVASLAEGESQAGDSEAGETVVKALPPPPAPIRDDVHFFVVRQQIVYAKQSIILAPADRSQSQGPEVKKVVADLTERSRNLRSYEDQHPDVKKSPRTWSNYGRDAVLRSAWVNPMIRQPYPPVGKERAARWLNERPQREVASKARTKVSKKRSKRRH